MFVCWLLKFSVPGELLPAALQPAGEPGGCGGRERFTCAGFVLSCLPVVINTLGCIMTDGKETCFLVITSQTGGISQGWPGLREGRL